MNSMRSVVVSKSAHNPPTAMPIISPTPRPEKNHAELTGECVIFFHIPKGLKVKGQNLMISLFYLENHWVLVVEERALFWLCKHAVKGLWVRL